MNWEEAVIWLKNQKDKQKLVQDCFYDDPLVNAAKRYWKSSEWEEVKKYVPISPGKVLDVGAGMGISSYAFSKEGWQVVALEPDRSSVVGAGAIRKLALETKLKIAVNIKWGEKMPFKSETFDVVYARQTLHHARNLKQLCREMARVLKKGGIFIATREHVISKKEDLPIFLKKHPLHKLYGGENAFLLNDYLNAIKNSGIEITEILNPFQSNINLYPYRNIYFPKWMVKFIGNSVNYPGRLYSFIGIKR